MSTPETVIKPVAARIVASGTVLGSVVFEYDRFKLHACGTFTHNGVVSNWYKDEKTRKPWIPVKRKTFVSLVKQMVREGDFANASDEPHRGALNPTE